MLIANYILFSLKEFEKVSRYKVEIVSEWDNEKQTNKQTEKKQQRYV